MRASESYDCEEDMGCSLLKHAKNSCLNGGHSLRSPNSSKISDEDPSETALNFHDFIESEE